MSKKTNQTENLSLLYPTRSNFRNGDVTLSQCYNAWFGNRGILIKKYSRNYHILSLGFMPTWSPEPYVPNYENWFTLYKSEDFETVLKYYKEFLKEFYGFKIPRSI